MRTSNPIRLVLVATALWHVPARPAAAEWTLGVLLGGASTRPSSITLVDRERATDVTVGPVRYRGESFVPPLYYDLRAALFPKDGWLGVEGEFIHLKVVADTTRAASFRGTWRGQDVTGERSLGALVERFSITHGVNLLLLNAVARRSGGGAAGRPRWIAAARVGAGASMPHPESTVAGVSAAGYEWGSFSAQAGAGVEVRVTGGLYVIGEYKLTRTMQNVATGGGSARTLLTTHHVLFGAAVHLGGAPAPSAAPAARTAPDGRRTVRDVEGGSHAR